MSIEIEHLNLKARCRSDKDLTDMDKLKLLRMFQENPSLFLKDFTTLLDGRLIKIIPDV